MENLLDKMPDTSNIVGWIVFITSNIAFIKWQLSNLLSEQKEVKNLVTQHGTDIAVVKEQVTSVKGKIENGLSHQVNETCERVARIEGACTRCSSHE